MFIMEDLIVRLYEIGAFKTGSFKLKSGITSPIYVDLRVIISYPDVLKQIVDMLCDVIKREIGADVVRKWKICGVPYTALPLATLISERFSMPMVMRRKEKKEYGTAQLIEGKFEAGDNVLIIEDLVTSGTSVFETAADLKAHGLHAAHAVLFLDREQGGINNLREHGINAWACTKLQDFLKVLVKCGKIDAKAEEAAIAFVASTQTTLNVPAAPAKQKDQEAPVCKKRRLAERAHTTKNEKTKKLLELIQQKGTNVIVAADVQSGKEVLELAERIGDSICVLKLHYDVLDWSSLPCTFYSDLKRIADEKRFMLMEDRKYADIGAIVQRQLTAKTCPGGYSVADWADFVTMHAISGGGALDAVAALPVASRPGVIIVAEMSTAENIIDSSYTEKAVSIALKHPEVVSGFVAQSDVLKKHADADDYVIMTPGVSLSAKGDQFGQQYRTPETVITQFSSDCVIVGRDIYKAENAHDKALEYRDIAIKALQKVSAAE